MTAVILVGSLVRVARPVGDGPVNREGHTGRVIDLAGNRHAREVLVDFGAFERWVPMGNVTVVAPHATALDDEMEGYAEYLDMLEARR